MSVRRPALWFAAGVLFVLLAGVAWWVGWSAGGPAAEPVPSSSASPSVSPARIALTARGAADRLAQLYPLPNLRVNTGYGADAGVVEAVTTDAVTVLRFDSEQRAQAWVDGFGKSGSADVRRAGVFVLSWASSGEQDLTAEEARVAMLAELGRLIGA